MNTILESELVVNDDGSIYHLHLLPEDIADTIILVGDPDRVSEVSAYFDQIELRKNKREFITHTGYIGKKRLTVISTGIGTDNIDIVMNELDALVNIDLKTREEKKLKTSLTFIRIGTSGSLQKDIPIDSFLASSYGLGLDSLMPFYILPVSSTEELLKTEISSQLNIPFIHPYVVEASGKIYAQFSKIPTGITATCCGFYAPQGRALRGTLRVPNLIERLHKVAYKDHRITNFEMETAGIYGMAKLLGHEAVSLSAILANRITHEFSKEPHKVIDKLIQEALHTITSSH